MNWFSNFILSFQWYELFPLLIIIGAFALRMIFGSVNLIELARFVFRRKKARVRVPYSLNDEQEDSYYFYNI